MVRALVGLAFVLTLLGAAYLGFASIQFNHDKLLHFSVFAILTVEFYFLWERQRPWKYTLLVMTSAAVGSEFAQNIVNPARKFDVVDILYNLHGVVLAIVICCVVQSFMSRRRSPNRSIELELRPSSTATSDEEIEGFVNVRSDTL